MDTALDPNPGHRSEDEWRSMLNGLMESLSAHTGIHFVPISCFIDDHSGHASASGCLDARGSVSLALRLEVCAVLCVSVNHGEAAWASAAVLLYSGGRRVFGPDGSEVASFRYTPDGWVSLGWMNSEFGEWEEYLTDQRWRQLEMDDAR